MRCSRASRHATPGSPGSREDPGPRPAIPRGEELAPGEIFGGYKIARLLGAGGMGVVYEAIQLSLERAVALKVLAAGLARDPQARQRFVQEGRLAARVTHPHLVTVIEVAEVSGRLLLAQELVVGETVQRRLEREGALPVALALEVAVVTAGALTALHAAGILHRDLKPGNLFLSRDRGVLVGDLGIAKDQLSTGVQTCAGTLLGTPLYMAPEVWTGRPVTAAADLYALGVVLFECLTGRPPFESEDPVELSRLHARMPVPPLAGLGLRVPEGLDALLGTALAKDPADRFPDAAAFERALRALPPVQLDTARTRLTPAGPRAGSNVRLLAATSTSREPALALTLRAAPMVARNGRLAKWAILGACLGLAALAIATALRPGAVVRASRPAPDVRGSGATGPVVRPSPEKPAAWMVSPSVPGDESLPELALAQRLLRDAREEVNQSLGKLRQQPERLELADAMRKTMAAWAAPLGSCRKSLEKMRDGVRRDEPATVERAARLLGSLLVLCCEMQDCFGWTARLWFSRPEHRGDVSAEIQVGMDAIRLKEALASAAMPVHEAVRPVIPGRDSAYWRAGVACWMTVVDSALPRDRGRPVPSELVRKSLLEMLGSEEGTALLLVRSLARAVRQTSDAQTAVRTLDEAISTLEKAHPAPGPAFLLAWFDLQWHRNWAAHELAASLGPDTAEERRRELSVWTHLRSRLILGWPHDPRGPPPSERSSAASVLAGTLNPDVQARLSDVSGWIGNVARDLHVAPPPAPPRPDAVRPPARN